MIKMRVDMLSIRNTINQVNKNMASMMSNITKSVTKGANESGKAWNRGFTLVVADSIMNITARLVGLTKKISSNIGSFLKLGASIETVFNRANAIFKENTSSVVEWANEIERGFGLNATDLLSDVATFTTLSKGFGVAADDASVLSKNLVLLSRDYAAFLGLSEDTVTDAMRSGLIGQTESIQKLGIQIEQTMLKQTAARYGIKKQVKDMTDVELAYMRYISIMDQAGDANGFFAKSLNSSQTQLTLISNTIKRIGNIVGQIFTSVFSKVGNYILGMTLMLEDMFKKLAKFMGIDLSIGGASSSKIMESSTGGVVDNLKDATKEAKKLRSTLPIDELVSLGKKDEGSIDVGAGNTAGIDPSIWDAFNKMESNWGKSDLLGNVKKQTTEWLDQLRGGDSVFNRLGESFDNNFSNRIKGIDFSNIKSGLESIRKSLGSIGTGVSGSFSKMLTNLSSGLGDAVGGFVLAGVGIGEGLIGGTELYLNQNKGRIIESLNIIYGNLGEFFANSGSIVGSLGEILGNFFSTESIKQSVANVLDILTTLVLGPAEIISKFLADATGELDTYLINMGPDIETSLGNVAKVIEGVTGIISKVVKDCFESIGSAYDKYVGPSLTDFRESFEKLSIIVMDGWNNYIYPVIESWIKEFNRVYDAALKPLIDQVGEFIGILIKSVGEILNKFILPIVGYLTNVLLSKFSFVFEALGNIVGTAVQLIAGILTGLLKTLGGLVTFITGIFTADWKKCWAGLKDIVKGQWDILESILKVPINLLIDGLNLIISAMNRIKVKVPDWVPEIGGKEFGVNIPTKVPKLADGGIVTSATRFIAGEAGPEVVFPLNNSKFIQDFAGFISDEFIKSTGGSNGAGGNVNVSIGTMIQDDRSCDWFSEKMAMYLSRKGFLGTT